MRERLRKRECERARERAGKSGQIFHEGSQPSAERPSAPCTHQNDDLGDTSG